MGLWDSLKAAKNFVTGGGAKVQLELSSVPPVRGEPYGVRVVVHAEADLNPKRIYLQLRSHEHVRGSTYTQGRHHSYSESATLYQTEIDVAGAVRIAAGETKEYTAQVMIPPDGQPTYHGKHSNHTWQITAAVDVPGNDPDSGWTEIVIR